MRNERKKRSDGGREKNESVNKNAENRGTESEGTVPIGAT